MIYPEELTRVFCQGGRVEESRVDPLLTERHTIAVGEFVSERINEFLTGQRVSRLEQMIQHLTLNVNYGLNDFHIHQLYSLNP
jgi:hypothetical protein